MSRGADAPDPVTFSILSSALVSLVDEMIIALQQSCMSFVIFSGDVTGGLLNANGELVAQGTRDVAVHVGALQPSTQAVIEDFGAAGFRPGDVYVFNEPYRGGTHLPDVTFISPLFWGGKLIAFTATKGHWSDVGGSTPGSMNVLAKDIYQEGLVIPPLKLVDAGVMRDDVKNLILSNLRLRVVSGADMTAHIEASRVGEARVHTLIRKYGLPTLLATFEESLAASERELVAEILRCPEGTWEEEDFLDYDPLEPDAGPVRVSVKMTLTHDPPRILYDVRGSDPSTHSGMNGTMASSYGALVAGTKYVFPKPLLNAGWLRVIEAEFPPSSVVNCLPPTACCGEVSGSYEKLTTCVARLWAHVRPERTFAGNFNLEYCTAGGVDDRPGRNNEYWVFYHWHTGGWGGKLGLDGRDLGAAIFGLGILNQSIEVIERIWPITFETFKAVTDSAGAGKWRGGVGVESTLRFENGGGARVSYVADRGVQGPGGPPGLFGGNSGTPVKLSRDRGTSRERELAIYFADEHIPLGGTFFHVSSGGGGYGDPLERDAAAVLEDVMDGFVSVASARDDYGLVVLVGEVDKLEYELDAAATATLRAELKASGAATSE